MQENHYKAKVNEQFDFPDLNLASVDVIPTGKNQFHLIKDGKNYNAELIDIDFSQKRIQLKINGSRYDVQLADQYDQLIKKLGLSSTISQQVKAINAPMPGLVLKVLVKPGQAITKGEPLLVLEAMKMENVLKSPSDGKVEKVHIETGAAVDKGQLLIALE